MSKLNKTTYYLKDVAVVQSPISYLNHRSDVNPYVYPFEFKDKPMLPIFVAPMSTVTDENNYKVWLNNKVTPVIPRSIQQRLSIIERLKLAKETFVSFSLLEAFDMFENNIFDEVVKIDEPLNEDNQIYICIDIAHGTLFNLFEICRKIKTKYNNHIIIMTGNIANPSAYYLYNEIGIDYVRCSIGTGSRCTSSANVSIGYGTATLLDEINDIRKELRKNGIHDHTKVILDGGIGWFDDIQKALALGADYVMMGKLFAECNEACEPYYYAINEEAFNEAIYFKEDEMIVKNIETPGIIDMFHKYRTYYGMSTKIGQKALGGEGSKTSEGISKPVVVKHSVTKFIDNVESYLRSCMTYTNSFTINDLHNAEVVILGGSGDLTYRK